MNGERKQSSNTKHCIFPIEDVIARISAVMTLLPGDVIATGTPGGVGPMQPGDKVEVRIEGIGSLKNPVIDEALTVGSDKLFLEDVRFYAHHGVTPAEQTVGAWFSVDVELAVDLAPAAVSDDLRTTVDYGLVAARIVEIGTVERVNLLERLAGRLAQVLLGEFPCREVRVRVRKLTPPMEGLLGTPASS